MKFQLATVTVLLAAFASALPSNGIVSKRTNKDVTAREAEVAGANFNFTDDFSPALTSFFTAIESIPDDVLAAGDDALNDWLVASGIREPGVTPKRSDEALDARDTSDTSLWERAVLQARVSWWKVTKCVASIVQALATVAIPAGKLLKIKRLIKDLGGTKDAVQLMLKATSKKEKLKVGGQALVDLSAELMGINVVKSNCF